RRGRQTVKCIHCNTDSKYKERVFGNQCKACKHRFAFEPKTDKIGNVAITDGLFKKAIEDASADGTLCFTDQQLWMELCRKAAKKEGSCLGCLWLPVIGLGVLIGGAS